MDKNITERHVSIKTVDGSLIQGKMNIGSMKRISDMFLDGESPFVIINYLRRMQQIRRK